MQDAMLSLPVCFARRRHCKVLWFQAVFAPSPSLHSLTFTGRPSHSHSCQSLWSHEGLVPSSLLVLSLPFPELRAILPQALQTRLPWASSPSSLLTVWSQLLVTSWDLVGPLWDRRCGQAAQVLAMPHRKPWARGRQCWSSSCVLSCTWFRDLHFGRPGGGG